MHRSRNLHYVAVILSLSLAILIVIWPYPKYTQHLNQNKDEKVEKITTEFQLHPPSFNQIFANDHGWIATLSAERVRTLVTTGDVMLGRSVNYKAVNAKNFNWPFEKTAKSLKTADITFINLEAPLVEDCPLTNEGMLFCGDTRHVNGLASAGVDLVSIANNHAKNYGTEGVNTTSDILNKSSIFTVGTSGAVIRDVRGLHFAFLAYNDVVQKQVDIDTLHAEISAARNKADIIVVMFHWGTEYTNQPTPRQRELAYEAINAGADIVVGNHPHWIQPIVFYREKPILYSQGNFIFDQMWSLKTRIGIVARFVFYDTTLIDIELLPVKIYNYGQPRFLTDDEKEKVIENMRKESEKLS